MKAPLTGVEVMFDVHFTTLSLHYSSSYYSNFCALSLLRGPKVLKFSDFSNRHVQIFCCGQMNISTHIAMNGHDKTMVLQKSLSNERELSAHVFITFCTLISHCFDLYSVHYTSNSCDGNFWGGSLVPHFQF